MFASLVLLGTGALDDPFHVDMPNYSMVIEDTSAMSAVVSIGVRDAPPHLPTKGSPLYPLQGDTYVLIGLDIQGLSDWHALLDRRYPGRDEPFRPDFP